MSLRPEPLQRTGYDAVDWSATALGPIERWTPTLRGAADLMLNTRFPVTLLWGPDFTLVYNEAYVDLIGDKHPAALGRPAREVFPEVWDLIGPMLQGVVDRRTASWVENEHVPLYRRGFLEECYFTFSYSPVLDPDGAVAGIMDIATETTEQVLLRRRAQLLQELTERLAHVEDLDEVPRLALPLLRDAGRDLAAVDLHMDSTPTGGRTVEPSTRERVEEQGGTRILRLPLAPGTTERSSLVVELSPHLAGDVEYLGFLRLVAGSLGQALDRVRARVAERRTTEAQRTISEAFQRSLVPEPRRTGRPEVAVRYQPAAELAQVGGDWYDLIEFADKSLAVVVGDVAGHDQQSAAAMAEVRNLLRGVAYTLHPEAPSKVLRGLDRAMAGMAQDMMATAVLAQVSGVENTLTMCWSNAGHPPPVLIGVDGSTRLLATEPDLLLGLDGDARRVDHVLELEPGATVLFYTDGLVERRGVALSDGLDWLVDALRGRHTVGVGVLCDDLLSAVSGAEDDIALLVLRA